MTKAIAPLVLRKRSEFLAVSGHGKKWVTPAFILQVAPRPVAKTHTTLEEVLPTDRGLGLTASKKMVGMAVQRNRARRRLRALAREVLAKHAQAGVNYVLIARAAALTREAKALRSDLEWALKRLGVWQEGSA